jgi:LPXTG-site transpeptidase (sortase) family protein
MMLKKLINYKILLFITAFSVAVILLFPAPLIISETNANFQLGNTEPSIGQAGSVAGWQMTANANSDSSLANISSQERFRLIIPSIGVDKQVIANVHPGSKSSYEPVIQNYVAHGKYTRLPDEATTQGNVYLFAHRDGYVNGRDIGFFKRLNELKQADQAILEYAGKKYVYEFRTSFVIDPKATWIYTAESKYPTLTLQTCENGIQNRLIVKLELVSVSS